MVAAVEEGGLGPGERHGVVGGDDDQGLAGPAGLLQGVEQAADAEVEAGDRLVVGGQVDPHVRQVRQVGRHDHLVGAVGHFRDVGVGLLVAEAAAGALRVGKADVQVEGPVPVFGEEAAGGGGQLGAVAGVDAGFEVERVDRVGAHVLFADAGGGEAGLPQGQGGGGHVGMGGEAVDAVAVAVLAVGVAVVPGEDAGAADGAGGAGAEGLVEDDPLPGEGVDARGADGGVAVAAGDAAPVVGDEEEDAAVRGHGGGFLICLRCSAEGGSVRDARKISTRRNGDVLVAIHLA